MGVQRRMVAGSAASHRCEGTCVVTRHFYPKGSKSRKLWCPSQLLIATNSNAKDTRREIPCGVAAFSPRRT
jgi:hypothetical protein